MEKAEQETTITYDLEEQKVRIFSAIRRDQGRLKRAGVLPVAEDKWGGMSYELPLTRLRWRVASATPTRRGFTRNKPGNVHTNAGIKTTNAGPRSIT